MNRARAGIKEAAVWGLELDLYEIFEFIAQRGKN